MCAYIRNNKGKEVGDWVVLTRDISSLSGTFEKGTKVKITGTTPMRGYNIEDEYGNKMYECGWSL